VIPIPILAPGERPDLEASDAVPEVDAGPSVGDGLPFVVCEPVFWLPVGLEVMGVEVTGPDDEVVGGGVRTGCESVALSTEYTGVCSVVWPSSISTTIPIEPTLRLRFTGGVHSKEPLG